MNTDHNDALGFRGPVKNMRRSEIVLSGLLTTGLLLGPIATARGDLFRDVAFGLGFAGFNIQGDRNILSGGADFLVNRNFVGNTLDFGSGDLTLAGPISFSASTGGRFLDTLDLSFRTAINANAPAAPLNYVLNLDSGSQSTQVSGTLFIDGNFSINGFGFYDFDLQYSSRQNVGNDGRITDTDAQFDADVGPINISGNIFADMFAAVTTPLFAAAGSSNPFASFSGSAKLNDSLQNDNLLRLLADGAARDMNTLVPFTAAIPGADGVDVFGAGFGKGADEAFRGVVPEPTVLLLLLAALPLIFSKRLRQVFSLQ